MSLPPCPYGGRSGAHDIEAAFDESAPSALFCKKCGLVRDMKPDAPIPDAMTAAQVRELVGRPSTRRRKRAVRG